VPTHHEQLGRYRLRFELASGGMATVYLAVARGPAGFGRVFAVKKIHPHLAREREFVDMFLDEARIASLIQHPNVVSVLDFGEADGAHFLAMEYVMGEPLAYVARALPRRAPPRFWYRVPEIAARIIAEACEGLHAAHETTDVDGLPLGVVHRDVSPHNLVVGYDGTVKVVDFGIAKAKNRIHQTQVGMVKGKFAYMSPEQLRGERVDRRSDVWSLGVVLWELVAGRPLFARPMESDTIMAVDRAEVPPLSRYRADVPEDLDAIVAKALARDPRGRYPTARELGVALSRWATAARAPIEAADVSDLMAELFADRKQQQRKLVASALSEPAGEATAHEEPGQDLSASAVVRVRPRKASAKAEVTVKRSAVTFFVAFGATVLAAAIGALVGLWTPAEATLPEVFARPSHAATPARDAELVVETLGGNATVEVEGTAVGPTPARVALPAGAHVVSLRPERANRTLRFVVDLSAGQRKTVRVDLGGREPRPSRSDR
jgi:serine/threonine-protein kinase